MTNDVGQPSTLLPEQRAQQRSLVTGSRAAVQTYLSVTQRPLPNSHNTS